MKAETFLRHLKVRDLDAKVVLMTGPPNYSERPVKGVSVRKDGTVVIR